MFHLFLKIAKVLPLHKGNKVNKLLLNVTKTTFLVIGKNRHIDTVQIYINGNAISKKRHVKFLGIVVDVKLEWREHINHIMKITSSLFVLRNARDKSKYVKDILLHSYLSTTYNYWTTLVGFNF